MEPATTAALIGGAATIIGEGTSAIGQSSLNKKTRQFNAEQAEIQRNWSEKMYNAQNAWNYEMWQKQNEYNSPSAQVERLREAGLNPLFYGLDGSSAGDLSAAQPLGYQRAEAGNYVNPLAGMSDIAARVAQVANIQANTAKTNNENISETVKREKMQTEIEQIKRENENLLKTGRLTEAQAEQVEKNNAWLDRINEANIAEKESVTALNKSTKNRIDELLEGEKIIQAKTAKDFEVKWQKVRAEIGKIAQETGILEKDIENYALNHANNGFMGTGLSLNNLFRLGRNVRPRQGEENNFSEGTDISDLINAGQ